MRTQYDDMVKVSIEFRFMFEIKRMCEWSSGQCNNNFELA